MFTRAPDFFTPGLLPCRILGAREHLGETRISGYTAGGGICGSFDGAAGGPDRRRRGRLRRLGTRAQSVTLDTVTHQKGTTMSTGMGRDQGGGRIERVDPEDMEDRDGPVRG